MKPNHSLYYKVDGETVHFMKAIALAYNDGYRGENNGSSYPVNESVKWLRACGHEVVAVDPPASLPRQGTRCYDTKRDRERYFLIDGKPVHYVELAYRAHKAGYNGDDRFGYNFSGCGAATWLREKGHTVVGTTKESDIKKVDEEIKM